MAIRVPDLCDEIDISSMIESHRYFAMDRKSTYIATTKLLKIFPKTKKKKKTIFVIFVTFRTTYTYQEIKFLVSTLNKLMDKKVGVASCRSLFSYVYAF